MDITKRDTLFLCAGVLIGLIGAYCFLIGFISAFDGVFGNVNITLSLNETRLVEEMNKTIIANKLNP